MKKNNTPFKFFVPLDITKGQDKDGKERMKIAGIASTMDEDSDGEFLDPQGFDLDYFLRYGFLNWHHQSKTNPSAIVGEPTAAYIKDRKMHVEGDLYADSPLAKDIYQLGKALQNGSSNRRLGFSIEGKVLERDPMNAKIVKRAQITGCAITPTPKNSHTLAEIVKGEVDDMDVPYEYEIQADPNGGESTFILDVVKPSGERVMVDSDFNITIKSMGTVNAAALIPEDVDGSAKDLQKVGRKKKKGLTKGEVYGQIFHFLHDGDIEKAKDIFKLIDTIHKSENSNSMNNTLSQESIDKAFATLGLIKGAEQEEEEGSVVKADDSEGSEDMPEDYEKAGDKVDDETKADAEKAEKAEKAEGAEDEDEDVKKGESMSDEDYGSMKKACDEMSSKLEKMKKSMNAFEMKKGMKTEGETMSTSAATEGGTEEPKDNESQKMSKGDDSDLSKADTEEISNPLADLIKGEMSKVGDKIEAMGTIQKSMSDNFESLESRVTAFENGTSGKKSITTAAYLKKGFDQAEGSDGGVTTLSTSINKAQILDILDSKAGITDEGIANMQFAKAMTMYEASGFLEPAIAHRLLVDEKIKVVS